MLQFLHGHSDRAAAEAVRCRIDFKYALCLELDDPGFHHSVLTDFRDRLLEDARADVLLDLALERIKEAGLVKARGTARTDSTYVLAHARDLTTLELVSEAIRATLEELARDGSPLLDALSTRIGPSATAARCAWASNPPAPRPASSRPGRTPTCCCAP